MDTDVPVSEEKEKRVMWLKCCRGVIQRSFKGLLADERQMMIGVGVVVERREDVDNIVHFEYVKVKCIDL